MKKSHNSSKNNDRTKVTSENKSLSKNHEVYHQQSHTSADKSKTSRPKDYAIPLSLSIFSSIVAIVTIIILIFAATYLQRLKTEINTLDSNLQNTQQQISSQTSDLSTIKQKMNAVTNTQEQQNKQLQDNQQQLGKLRQMIPDVKEDLGLNDIEQLINIANIKLYWQKDIPGSIALLETVDQQIAKLDDPNLLPIRTEIARKRNQLQSIPQVDINGLLIELNTISEQVPNLAVIKKQLSTNEQSTSPPESRADDTEQSTWKNLLTTRWEDLQQFIIIRHHDLAAQPLLPPEQTIYLVENIQLNLTKAQWAILQSDQSVYNTSLQQTIEWIETHLNSTPQAAQIVDKLKKLQTVTLSPELPDLNDLLEMIQTSVQDRGSTAAQEEIVDPN